jgi:phospholipid/cholesterol/gamma-HCH transport system substrate-binding protein
MRRRLRAGAVMAVALVVVAGAIFVAVPRSQPPYRLQAVFASADGLFPGNTVDILGVPAGRVIGVANTGNQVVVTMQVDSQNLIPATAQAALVSPELLGEPSIELSPGYTGGSALAAGSTIPESRTSVPISTDQLLRDLQSFLSKINPGATGSLITNLAQDVSGQGSGLNQLLKNAAGTLQLLAQKGNDLGQLSGTLAQISASLRGRTATITSLIQNYDTVSQVIAAHQSQLGAAITDLGGATTQLSQFLAPNLQPLETDVAGVTQVGRTLSANLSSIDQTLSSAVLLFAAAQRAYDPSNQWLNLNNQLAPGVTVAVVTGLLRDRLAGICRRLQANHATGLSAATLQTLATCGNPSSGFFDPIFSYIPPILNALTTGPNGGPNPAALQSLLSQGLAMIPGGAAATTPAPAAVPAATPAAPTTPSPAPTTAPAPTLTPPAAAQLPAAPTVPTNTQANGGSGSGGLLGGLLGGL